MAKDNIQVNKKVNTKGINYKTQAKNSIQSVVSNFDTPEHNIKMQSLGPNTRR